MKTKEQNHPVKSNLCWIMQAVASGTTNENVPLNFLPLTPCQILMSISDEVSSNGTLICCKTEIQSILQDKLVTDVMEDREA